MTHSFRWLIGLGVLGGVLIGGLGLATWWRSRALVAAAESPGILSPAPTGSGAPHEGGTAAASVDPLAGSPYASLPPPPNPFVPLSAEEVSATTDTPQPSPAPVAAAPSPLVTITDARPSPPVPAPAVAAAPSPDSPGLDPPRLRGIISGEPGLALVRWRNHTYFLKVGERIADAWELLEIREQSAVFRHGERRIEVPIEGGSVR